MESLVSNAKTFEKYTSQFWLSNGRSCSKNIMYWIIATNVSFPIVFHGLHSNATSFLRNWCSLTASFAKETFYDKKVNIFWNFIKSKVKVTLGVFLNFVYDNSFLWTKKVHGYLISFEPQMVRSSYKDHVSNLKSRLS